MSLVRQEPWNLLRQFNDEINRMLSDGRTIGRSAEDNSDVVTSHWAPAVDIKEEPNQFVLKADIPGVDPKDIEITMENSVLTIKGERNWENAEERSGYSRVERVRGTFYRRFSLPDTANGEGITAKSDKGVLVVTIPKQEKSLPRRIQVSA